MVSASSRPATERATAWVKRRVTTRGSGTAEEPSDCRRSTPELTIAVEGAADIASERQAKLHATLIGVGQDQRFPAGGEQTIGR